VKVGDLVKYRHPETDDEDAIAIVIGKTIHSGVFRVLELSGFHKGEYTKARNDDWEVLSEGG